MNIYKVDGRGSLHRVPVSGLNIKKAGKKKVVEFEVEFRIFYEPNPEQGSVDVRIEFPAGKHWEGVENIAEGIVSDITAAAGSVRDTIAEQWPGMTVGEITPVVITSDMSAVPDLFEEDEDEVLSDSMRMIMERQKKLREQRDAVMQGGGPAGPSQSGGGPGGIMVDDTPGGGGSGPTVDQRERETQGG